MRSWCPPLENTSLQRVSNLCRFSLLTLNLGRVILFIQRVMWCECSFFLAGSTRSAPKSARYSESELSEILRILSRYRMRPLLLKPSQRRMILAYTESTKSDKTVEYLTDLKKVEDIGDSQYWSQLRLVNVEKMGTTKLKQLYLLETALTAHKRLFF
jgi:hypothetical protein